MKAYWSGLTPTVRATVLMLGAALFFSGMSTGIRYAADAGMHAFQIAFFRNVFGLVFLLPWLMRAGLAGLRTSRLRLHGLRAFFNVFSMMGTFYAITVLPLAQVTALNFTVPLFATLLAPFILKEVVGPRRLMATLIGFAGALVIVRPGAETMDPTSLIVLGSALLSGMNIMIVKILARTENPEAIAVYMVLLLIPLSLLPALFVWQWPSLEALLAVVVVGGLGTAGHILFNRGFALADASYLIGFDYTKLPFVALFAWLFFAQSTSLWTWAGAAIIAGAGFYIARREA
ncbi:MAG: DMT family transporter, partial [Alphaproteobacteria bacterium]